MIVNESRFILNDEIYFKQSSLRLYYHQKSQESTFIRDISEEYYYEKLRELKKILAH